MEQQPSHQILTLFLPALNTVLHKLFTSILYQRNLIHANLPNPAGSPAMRGCLFWAFSSVRLRTFSLSLQRRNPCRHRIPQVGKLLRPVEHSQKYQVIEQRNQNCHHGEGEDRGLPHNRPANRCNHCPHRHDHRDIFQGILKIDPRLFVEADPVDDAGPNQIARMPDTSVPT